MQELDRGEAGSRPKPAAVRQRIKDVVWMTEGQPARGRDAPADELGVLLTRVARGDLAAYEAVYDRTAGQILGIVLAVLRDPAQSEEVAQEVLLEIWRMASRFDPDRGSATAWALTIAHRRAVDRVRSENACSRREQKAAEPEPVPALAEPDPVLAEPDPLGDVRVR